MSFGDKLKKTLDEMNITQRQFADMVDRREGYISRIINNKLNVSWETINLFANALNISPAAFFEEKEDEIIASAIRNLPDDLIEFIESRPNAPYLYLGDILSAMNYRAS